MKSIYEVKLIDKTGDCWCCEYGIASTAEEAIRACMKNNNTIRGLRAGAVNRIADIQFGLPATRKRRVK